jgi:hypothetical protein
MPHDDPGPDDPHILVGVALPGGPEAARDMAAAIAEEFAAMGLGEEQIMGLFRNPFYAGAHRAMALLGATAVRRMVRESLDVWGRMRIEVRDARDDAGAAAPLRIGRRSAADEAPEHEDRARPGGRDPE